MFSRPRNPQRVSIAWNALQNSLTQSCALYHDIWQHPFYVVYRTVVYWTPVNQLERPYESWKLQETEIIFEQFEKSF